MLPESTSPSRDPNPDFAASPTAELQHTIQALLQQQQRLQNQLDQQQLQLQAQLAAVQHPNPVPVREPRARLPEPFGGDSSLVRGFINQVKLVIQQQPNTYATETSRVLLVGSLLTGLAREWFNPIFEDQDPAVLQNFQQFLYALRMR